MGYFNFGGISGFVAHAGRHNTSANSVVRKCGAKALNGGKPFQGITQSIRNQRKLHPTLLPKHQLLVSGDFFFFSSSSDNLVTKSCLNFDNFRPNHRPSEYRSPPKSCAPQAPSLAVKEFCFMAREICRGFFVKFLAPTFSWNLKD